MSFEAKMITGIVVVTVAIFIGAAVLLGNSSGSSSLSNQTASQDLLVRKNSHKIVAPQQKVILVEFGDYQCPACGAAEPTVEQLLASEKDKMTFVFRNFPLSIHQNAQIAAEAAEAAGAQGKYFPMHNELYATQNIWGDSATPLDDFLSYAKDLGLNVDQFKQAVSSNKYAGVIQQDMQDGNALGVNATPTFYINGHQYSGDFTYAAMKQAIDQAASH